MLLRVADPGSGRVISPGPDRGGNQEAIRDNVAGREARTLEVSESRVAAEIPVWQEDFPDHPPALPLHLI